MRQRLCCNCYQGDLCDAEIYTECEGADRIDTWLVDCGGTVYDCTPTPDCSACAIGYVTGVSMTLHVYHGEDEGSGFCDVETTCGVSGAGWHYFYDGWCDSHYELGADGTSYDGDCLDSDLPVDFFSACGDCYTEANSGYKGMVQAAGVGTRGHSSLSEEDLTWYKGFDISGDLVKFKEGEGCEEYRTGEKALWKITVYQENENTAIRFRWYFRDCCYHEEYLSINGGSSDGGNTLSGVANCINLTSDEHGVVATGATDTIFEKISLEVWDEEKNIIEEDASIYFKRCEKMRYGAMGLVDFGYMAGGQPEDCDCSPPRYCEVHWGGNTYEWTAFTDWVQIVTVDDYNNFDSCVGGNTFTGWTGYGDPYGGVCDAGDCYITDVTFTAVSI